jgi:ribonuclease HII
VVLARGRRIPGLADSKLLRPARREALAEAIRSRAEAWSVASATVEEIDRLNILNAALLAMRRAVEGLATLPDEAWVDGNRCPELGCRTRAIVRGDRRIAVISAASILAKSARDAEMRRLHARYPQYRLDRHKGYPTREHLTLLERYGACEIHRRSFAPVRRMLGTLPLEFAAGDLPR